MPGSLTRPDPAGQTAELDRVRRELAAAEVREHNGDNGHNGEATRLGGEQQREVLDSRPVTGVPPYGERR